MSGHLKSVDTSHRSRWVQKLLRCGHFPSLAVLLEVPRAEWKYWERLIIAGFRKSGFDLCNIQDGGEGGAWNRGLNGFMRHSEETKRMLSEQRSTPEYRKQQSDRTRKNWAGLSPEDREHKLRGARKKKSPQHRLALSRAMTGRSPTNAHRAAISAGHAWKGKKRPEQAAAMRAHYSDPEARLRTGVASKKAWADPARRAAARRRKLGSEQSSITRGRIRVAHIINGMRTELYGDSIQ